MMSFDTHSGFEPPSPREEMETLTLADDPHPLSAVSATADGGGDPLLHHPPSTFPLHSPRSPSSSHPFLDPPSYADAVFSPFESQNGGSGHLSQRNGGHSLPSLRSADSEYVKITVSDPQKEQESANSLVPGGSTYVTYLITSRARDPDGGAPDFAVRRRFRDVVTLADRLAESYRGFFIPPRPDKGVVESQVMQKQEFVEQRRAALEKYLWRLATHPVIGRSDELSAFLGAPGKLPLPGSSDMGSRMLDEAVQLPRQLFGDSAVGNVVPQDVVQQAKGGRDFLRIFKELKQSVANDWGGVKPLVVEEDKEFLERKEKIQDLEQQLTNASQQAETLVKAQQDIGETMGELGLSFFKLAKFETEEAIHNSQRMRVTEIKCFATAAVKASRFCRESNAQTVKHLDTLHEYLGLMLAAHSAFSDRSSALLTVQTLMSDLSSLQTKTEKLEAASSRTFGGDKTRIRKIVELKETIRTTEDSKSCALREYERIKENNRSELERLDRERHNDFLGMLKGFVINQVGYAEKIASVWAMVVEETSRYATESN